MDKLKQYINREIVIYAILITIVCVITIGIGAFITNKKAKAEEVEKQKLFAQIEKQQGQEQEANDSKKDAPSISVAPAKIVPTSSNSIVIPQLKQQETSIPKVEQTVTSAITVLSDSDIQRLQTYKQYSTAGEQTSKAYVPFFDMYTKQRSNCDALMNKFSPLKLSDYTNAKVGWLTDPKLVYRSVISQYCVRGILSLTFYDENNKFGLKPNQEYQVDIEYRLLNSVSNGEVSLKLESIHYLSDLKAVK